MKILYIIKQDIDATGRSLVDRHRELADVSIVELTAGKDYADIIKQVFNSDKVICW